LLSGTEIITYYNNSPDTLGTIWFKLYPNLYKEGVNRDSNIHPSDLTSGVEIEEIAINSIQRDAGVANIDGTNMTVDVPALSPGQKMQLTIEFSYMLNEHSHIRTGQVDPGAYFVAYFFPRITVYDDIDGWNTYSYTGSEEFYNDFSDFYVNITVPKGYAVWATGTLQNRSEVYASKYVQRIEQAENQNETVTIIDSTDLKQGNITAQNPINT